jgi:RND family efflux transporter MFP subunit
MKLIAFKLLLAGGLLLATLSAEANQGALPTAAAEYLSVPREYRLDGVVEAVKQTTVSAQTQGQVEDILFDVDDSVERGKVLVRLRDTEHRAQVIRSAAELKEAVARQEQTREAFERTEGLFAKQLASESALDEATAELKSAEARMEAASAALSQAKEQLEYTEVRAPYSGIVTERFIELGETAQPGQPLISGVSLDELRVNVSVPQSVIASVRQLDRARVQLPDGSSVVTSEITVFPFADPASNSFRVRLDLPSSTQQLFPGMFVKTAFVIGEKQVLVVPAQAIVRRSEVTAVYVVDAQQRIQFRQIRVGATNDGKREVLAGLELGERVALDPITAGAALKRQAEERSNG